MVERWINYSLMRDVEVAGNKLRLGWNKVRALQVSRDMYVRPGYCLSITVILPSLGYKGRYGPVPLPPMIP